MFKKFWTWYKPIISNPWVWAAFLKGLVLGLIIGWLILT